jgi:hypothetical protein
LVKTLQVVGWKAEPPEAAPGSNVTLQVVALAPGGPVDPTATSWTFCHAAKPLDEDRVVTASCLVAGAPDAVGDPVQVALPTDACRLFGPDTPQPAPGAPPTRPRDADATGGYFQPVTMALGDALAVGLERVTCDLPDASLAAARAFQAAYHPNQNPMLTGLALSVGGAPVDPAAVPAGAALLVTATWTADALETFPVFDRASGTIVDVQETLVGSWYVTTGDLAQPAVEIADAAVVSAGTGWTVPAGTSTAELVFVLRDSRGGADVARMAIAITPGP